MSHHRSIGAAMAAALTLAVALSGHAGPLDAPASSRSGSRRHPSVPCRGPDPTRLPRC
jgi:hypothetical protein